MHPGPRSISRSTIRPGPASATSGILIPVRSAIIVFPPKAAVPERRPAAGTCALSCTCILRAPGHRRVEPGKAELVIDLSFFFIAQDLIRFLNLFKFLLSCLVICVDVRMILFCEFSIRALDPGVVSGLRDAKDFIIISLCAHFASPLVVYFSYCGLLGN